MAQTGNVSYNRLKEIVVVLRTNIEQNIPWGNYDIRLRKQLEKLALWLHKDLDSSTDLKEFGRTLEAKCAEVLKENPEVSVEELTKTVDNREDNTDDQKPQSRVTDRELMKQLLEDYDQALAKKKEGETEKDILEKLKKDNKYSRIKTELEEVIKKKKEIEEGLKKNEKLLKLIPEESVEAVAATIAKEEIIAENNGRVWSKETEAALEEYIISNLEANSNQEELKNESKELRSALKKEGVKNEEIKIIIADSKEYAAKIIVEVNIDKETEDIVAELCLNNPEVANKRAEVKKLVKERVKASVLGENKSIFENKVVGEGTNQKAITFEDEIKTIAGISNLGEYDKSKLRKSDEDIKQLKESRTEAVRSYRQGEVRAEVYQSLIRIKGVDEATALEMATFTAETLHGKSAYTVQDWKEVDGDKGQNTARMITDMLRSETPIETRIKRYKEIRSKINIKPEDSEKISIKLKAVDDFFEKLEKTPGLKHLLEASRRWVRLQEKFNGITTKMAGKVVVKIATKIGVDTSGQFMMTVAEIGRTGVTVEVLTKVATSLLGKTTVLALKTSTEAIATKAAETAAGKALVWVSVKLGMASSGVAAPVVLLITVAEMAIRLINYIRKGINDSVKNFYMLVVDEDAASVLSKVTIYGNGLFNGLLGIGTGIVIGVGAGIAAIGGSLFSMSRWTFSISTKAIGAMIISLIGLMTVFSIGQSWYYAAIVPPAMENGNCVLLNQAATPAAGSGGNINCNQNLDPEEYQAPGVNRDNFIDVANRWKPEHPNFAKECYADVVCRARSAGVNEAFALWVWVHESGASNYFRDDIEDFGIHGRASAPPRDFNAQINFFMSLNHTNPCTNLDFWLGWATNYQTGQRGDQCDPDEPVDSAHPNNTGRNYLNEILNQWRWISPETPMPGSIKGQGTGESCGSEAEISDDGESYTYVDENGDTWKCSTNNGSPYTVGNMQSPNFTPWTAEESANLPDSCPHMLPTTSGAFTQGPFAPGCSHQSMSSPAIDIGVGAGTYIRATHGGVIQQASDGIYGYYIDLHGKCNGVEFVTRYAHMPEGGYRVADRAEVQAGDFIGVVDNTGSSTGNHLHYHITGLDNNKFGMYLGLDVETTKQLWACCGSWNGKYCPPMPRQ